MVTRNSYRLEVLLEETTDSVTKHGEDAVYWIWNEGATSLTVSIDRTSSPPSEAPASHT